MTTETKRMAYVDWIKAICIVLVAIGHFLPRGDAAKVIFYTFHVPAFIFVGGFLLKCPKGGVDCLKKIGRLFVRVFIPYSIWHLLSGAYYIKRGFRTWKDVWDTWFFLDGKTIWNDALWYAPLIFFVSMVFLLLCWVIRGNRYISLGVGLASLGGFAWFGIKGIPITLFGHANFLGGVNLFLYFGVLAIGYACRPLVQSIAERKKEPLKNPWLWGSAAIFVVLLGVADRLNHGDRISLLYFDYNNVIVFAVFGVLLSLSLLMACALLPDHPIAELLSKNSFFIMCSHYFFYQWWIKDGGIGTEPQLLRVRWALAVMMLVLYLLFLFFVRFLCKKIPILSKGLTVFGMQF